MRLFYFLFLLVFTGAAAILALENQQDVYLKVFDQSYHTNVPVLVGLAYLAGMVSGWTVVGILRRSINRVTHEPFERESVLTR